MVYCCLGWGSLFWDARDLPVCSIWNDDGPSLPVEFARQSADGRITLVVTPNTPDVEVLWAELAVSSIAEAGEALAEREGITSKYFSQSVGLWSKNDHSAHREANSIGDWAENRGFDGVVWTALKPKFDTKLRTPTSLEVLTYLGSLQNDARAKAEEYVRKTPRQIATPYRDLIVKQLGWNFKSGQ